METEEKELRSRKKKNRLKRRRRGYLVRAAVFLFCVVWTGLAAVGLMSLVRYKMNLSGAKQMPGGTAADIAKTEGRNTSVKNGEIKGKKKKDLGKWEPVYEKDKELLILVNKENRLDDSYQPSLKSICNGRLMASEKLYDSLCQMLEDAEEAGFTYWIASAYRDPAYQQELVDEDVQTFMEQGMSYEEALEKTYEETMPVGSSEHETGLALDILCSQNTKMDVSQAYEPGNQWLQEHCYEYGFILRYPEDKVDITKINYEPWHFRYVGKEAAKIIWENELTLEEFYQNVV